MCGGVLLRQPVVRAARPAIFGSLQEQLGLCTIIPNTDEWPTCHRHTAAVRVNVSRFPARVRLTGHTGPRYDFKVTGTGLSNSSIAL